MDTVDAYFARSLAQMARVGDCIVEFEIGTLVNFARDKLAGKANVTAIDALSLAKEAGNGRAVNVVLIGLMAKNTQIPYERWIETLKTTVPPKFLDVNLKAFELGYNC